MCFCDPTFHFQLVKEGQVWIDMLEDLNLMAHVYQEQAALAAGKSIRNCPDVVDYQRISHQPLKKHIDQMGELFFERV